MLARLALRGQSIAFFFTFVYGSVLSVANILWYPRCMFVLALSSPHVVPSCHHFFLSSL